MALTVDQITQNILTQLQILDPVVSAEVGTPERIIIEAVAEMIASQQVDLTILNQQHDLATMAGGRLDSYLGIFNFGRQSATPSYGFVTFGRNTAALTPILIPQGTQVLANINDPVVPTLIFTTTQTVILNGGETSITAPVQCTISGSVTNISAGAINAFGSLRNIPGITIVTNPNPTQGGTDQESDSSYKIRFQNSFLRNISGTTDMFLSLAVAVNSVSKANVVGPISRYQEYIQIPDDNDLAQLTQTGGYDDTGLVFPRKRTSAKSSIPFSKFTYPTQYFLTDGSLDPATAVFFRPEADYVFNTPPIDATVASTQSNDTPASSPNVTFLNPYDPVDNAPAAATAVLTSDNTEPVDADTVTINDVVYRFKTTMASANDVKRSGVDADTDLNNLIKAVNQTGTPGTHYFAGTVAPTGVTAGAVASHAVTFTATTSGALGNLFPKAASSSHLDWDGVGAFFTGGVDGGDTRLSAGGVVLLEHAFMSVSSRNSYDFGILNCIDVFVDGEQPRQVSSIEVVPDSSYDLQNTTTTLWTYQKTTATTVINFRRKLDSLPCRVGNRIIPVYWQPMLTLPESVQIGSSTYFKANYFNEESGLYYNQFDGTDYSFPAHYIECFEVNGVYGTVRCRNGMEWFGVGDDNYAGGQLVDDDGDAYSGVTFDTQAGTQFVLDGYTFDQNISDLQAIMEKKSQVTQDVLVHKGKLRYFRPIITIMYNIGATKSVVDASIAGALNGFFTNTYFGSAIQLSDILQVIHNVPGVDNVRWTDDDPDTGVKMEEVGADGSQLPDGPINIITDFFIQDDELAASPSANAVEITVRAPNTWGT